MTDWLLHEENYIPSKGRDAFIDKSILAFLRLLARIRIQDSMKDNRIKNGITIRPVYKLCCAVLLILLVSLSQSFAFVFSVITILLLRISFLPLRDLKGVMGTGAAAAAFSLVILLPAAFLYGNTYSMVMIPGKVFATVTIAGILSRTSRWSGIIGALRIFHVPSILIFIFDITIKYIFMLGEFTLELLQGLKLRSVGSFGSAGSIGGSKRKYFSLGGIAGTAFLKSRTMAEEMRDAMECRGFTGEYHVPAK